MARSWGILSAGLLAASIALAQQPPTQNFRKPPGGLSMPMVAPLFLEDKDFSSTVTLVNDAVAQMRARVVVLDSQGVQVAFKEVEMPGHTSLPIQILDLLTEAGSAANSGSVLVIPEPVSGMPIGAQLSIASKTGTTPAYMEEEMLTPDEGRQGIYRASALAVKGSPIIALKSLGQGTQSVTLECFAEKTAPTKGTIQLLAGELLLVAACDSAQTGRTVVTEQMSNDQVDRGSVGVAVSTSGTTGDLITYGFSIYNDERGPYFSSLNFANPTEQQSPSTIFTGIPAGGADLFPRTIFRPEVAVSNFSTKPAEVTVTLAHTIAGKTSTELVQKLVLAGQSSHTVKIPTHGDPAMTNSLVVRSSLPPGQVVSQFVAWGDFQVRTVELQAKDNDSVQNGGGHPWTIEPGTDSTLLLFNHSTDGPKRFNVLINSGEQLWQNHYLLGSMETKAVSIRDIVEKQVHDEKGKTLAKETLSGQVGWWTRRPRWGKGRLMVSSPQNGLARSYSCGNCAVLCNFGAHLDPFNSVFTGIGDIGDLGFISVQQCLITCTQPCGGTPEGPSSEATYHWTSGNTSIATISGYNFNANASFRGVAPGMVNGNFTATDGQCTAPGHGTVTVKPKVTISGSTNIAMLATGSQGTDSTTLTATGTPSGGTYSWTAVSGQGNITILNANAQSAIVQSVAVGNYTVQVIYTYNGFTANSAATGKVQRPGSLGVITNTTPQFNCANVGLAYITKNREIQYQVLDTSSPAVPIPVTGMDLTETLNGISNTCGTTYPDPTQHAHSGSNGYFPLPDTLQACSPVCLPADANGNPTGGCMMKVAQTWSVNGFPVKSGTLTYTCPGPPTGAP